MIAFADFWSSLGRNWTTRSGTLGSDTLHLLDLAFTEGGSLAELGFEFGHFGVQLLLLLGAHGGKLLLNFLVVGACFLCWICTQGRCLCEFFLDSEHLGLLLAFLLLTILLSSHGVSSFLNPLVVLTSLLRWIDSLGGCLVELLLDGGRLLLALLLLELLLDSQRAALLLHLLIVGASLVSGVSSLVGSSRQLFLDCLLSGLNLTLLLGLKCLNTLLGLLVVPLGTLLSGVEFLSKTFLSLSQLLRKLSLDLLALSSLVGRSTLADLKHTLIVLLGSLLDGRDLSLVVGGGECHLAVN